jgi:hypothetical protein
METGGRELVITSLYRLCQVTLQEKSAGKPFPKKLLNGSFNIVYNDTWATNLSNMISEYAEALDEGFDISGRRLGLVNVSGISVVTNFESDTNCLPSKKALEVMSLFKPQALIVTYTLPGVAPTEVFQTLKSNCTYILKFII